MIDLYAAGTSNGMRARIALEECGLPYKLHPVDIAKGEQKTAAFLAMNPNGQIPGLVQPIDAAARPAVLQALMSASTDVTPIFGALFAVKRSKEPHAPTAQMFSDRLHAFFKVWDEALANRKYCAGDEVTVADFSLYAGYARIKGAAPEIVESLPNVTRWAEAMAARPAIQRAVKF